MSWINFIIIISAIYYKFGPGTSQSVSEPMVWDACKCDSNQIAHFYPDHSSCKLGGGGVDILWG